ncbi:hypothetical protein [Acuticoccus kandeliae]|uniref:hypothetical protein n=1 Tax=Acuticoccus kandeliae TaxID=2073160 RepID=UPI000D3E5699|nr:hypothetical protein [Acuticoccus kandeliae]
MKTTLYAALAGILIASFGAGIANAQTEGDCTSGIEALNTAITSQQGITESARSEARTLSEQASNAKDANDYARCVELVKQANTAIGK